MKKLWLISVLLMAVFLGGCTGLTGPIDVNELAYAATDRIGAHVQIRMAETAVAGKVADTLRVEAELAIAKLKIMDSVEIKITDAQSMALYQLGEANKALARSNELMGEVAIALTIGKSKYADLVQFTPFPGGAFAEAMDSFFGGSAKVLNTPIAGIVAGGWAAKELVKVSNEGSGIKFYDQVTADSSFNKSTLSVSDSVSSSGTLAPSVVAPEIVEPVIIEN